MSHSHPATLPQTIRVALVEDQRGLRESLKEVLLNSEGITCVAACANGEEAMSNLPSLGPDVVFMDINLPGMDGVSCVRELTRLLPDTLWVMLTVYDNTEAVFNSLQAGASGYLQKPVKAKDLIAAAREVMAGGSPMTAKIARLVVQAFRKPATGLVMNATEAELTLREQAVLDQLVAGFSYKEIGEKLQVSDHTVHFHIRNIYKKLQVRSRAQAVAKVMKK
jgi:DNA-binding NarL/FixJ family response regulator